MKNKIEFSSNDIESLKSALGRLKNERIRRRK